MKRMLYEGGIRAAMGVRWPGHVPAGKESDFVWDMRDVFPTLCDLAGLPKPSHLAGKSFVPLLDDPKRKWKKYAVSQFPNPALREWAANPLSSGMRQTFFGPLIDEVETKIIKQQGDSWDRDLFENHLMGYSLRTDLYRLVAWLDYRDIEAEPLYVELYDQANDPEETANVAKKFPKKTEELLVRLRTSGIGKGVSK